MKTITNISGIDNKVGRRSRTGSTISMTIPEDLMLDVMQYYMSYERNEEPTGKIKKIELSLIYEDDEKYNADEVFERMEKELDRVVAEEIDSQESEEKTGATNQPDLPIYGGDE